MIHASQFSLEELPAAILLVLDMYTLNGYQKLKVRVKSNIEYILGHQRI
jgi:hypothetical protein